MAAAATAGGVAKRYVPLSVAFRLCSAVLLNGELIRNGKVTPCRGTIQEMNRDQFADGEWYHVFNRGVDKRKTFNTMHDYERMQELLYLANSETPLHRSNRERISHDDVFSIERGAPLVAIAAYCLMPNHFHMLLRQESVGGVTAYMRKLMTGYTMYFNIKNNRVGNLFYKPFRSRHVPDDRYGQRVYNYILANPWELVRTEGKATQLKFISTYPFSNLIDQTVFRAESAILHRQDHPFIVRNPHEILSDAHLFDEGTAR